MECAVLGTLDGCPLQGNGHSRFAHVAKVIWQSMLALVGRHAVGYLV